MLFFFPSPKRNSVRLAVSQSLYRILSARWLEFRALIPSAHCAARFPGENMSVKQVLVPVLFPRSQTPCTEAEWLSSACGYQSGRGNTVSVMRMGWLRDKSLQISSARLQHLGQAQFRDLCVSKVSIHVAAEATASENVRLLSRECRRSTQLNHEDVDSCGKYKHCSRCFTYLYFIWVFIYPATFYFHCLDFNM